jgi:O-antigen/teichoic acid export membrane protein
MKNPVFDKKLFAKNSFSGLFQKIVIAVITFLAIPIFIRTKGSEIYGIFAAISVLGELGRLTELGFNKTLVKFLSAQGITKESSQDIMVATGVVMIFLIPLTAVLILSDHFILLNLLKVPPDKIHESLRFYYCAVLANALLLLGSLYSSVIESQRYIYKINMLQLIYSLLYWGLIIIVLLLGFGLEQIGYAILFSAFLWFILIVGVMRSIWGRFSFEGFGSYLKTSLKKLTNYSLKVYLSGLLALFEEPVAKVLVSNFFGVTYVGYLDIAIRIKSQLYRLLQTLVYPFFQLFAEIQDKNKLRQIIKDVEEKLFIAIAPLTVILIVFIGPFIKIWLGTNEPAIIYSSIIICAGALLLMFTIMPTIYYLTIYHPFKLVLTQAAIIFVNVATIYVSHFFIGFYSVYLSFILMYLSQAFLRLYYQKKYLQCVLFSDRKYFINFIFSISILLCAGLLTNLFFRGRELMALIVNPLLISVLTIILYKQFGMITRSDIEKYLGQENIRFFKVFYKTDKVLK